MEEILLFVQIFVLLLEKLRWLVLMTLPGFSAGVSCWLLTTPS